MEEITSTLEFQQGTPTQPLSSNPDPRMPHLARKFWNQLDVHCPRVSDTECSADGEQETCVSVENKILIYN